jgi:hypothetical protein
MKHKGYFCNSMDGEVVDENDEYKMQKEDSENDHNYYMHDAITADPFHLHKMTDEQKKELRDLLESGILEKKLMEFFEEVDRKKGHKT